MTVIFLVNLHCGLTAYGGFGATLAIAEREWVVRRRILTEDDLGEAQAWARLFPGSAAVQLVSSLGSKLGGWPGSAAATVAFLLPSVLAMLALGAVAGLAARPPALRGATGGLMAAAAGLLLGTGVRLGWKAGNAPGSGRRNGRGADAKAGPRPAGPRRKPVSLLQLTAVLAIAIGAFASGMGKFGGSALTVLAAGLLGILLFRPAGNGSKGDR